MTAVDWRRVEAHLKLQAVLWHAMAEAAYRTPRPELAHLSRDFGGEVGHLYRKLAQTAESFADQAREIAYAEEHPACEGDCGEDSCTDVGRVHEYPAAIALVRGDVA